MNNLFFVVLLLSLVALVVGMIKPNIVVRWGDSEKRNRKSVLKTYGLALIASFMLFVVTFPSTDAMETEVTGEDENIIVQEVEEVEEFELSESDRELLVGNYADFSREERLRFKEIRKEYNELDDDAKLEIDRLNEEKEEVELAEKEIREKKAEEKRVEAEKKAEEERIEAEKKAEEERIEAEKKAEEERIQAEKEAEEKAKAEEEKYNTGITVKDIARDKNGLIGSYVKFYGKIIQVMQGEDYTQYRLAVDNDYDQVVLIEIQKDDLDSNILEDDYITIEGMSFGNVSYTTVLGAEREIPAIIVDNFTLH